VHARRSISATRPPLPPSGPSTTSRAQPHTVFPPPGYARPQQVHRPGHFGQHQPLPANRARHRHDPTARAYTSSPGPFTRLGHRCHEAHPRDGIHQCQPNPAPTQSHRTGARPYQGRRARPPGPSIDHGTPPRAVRVGEAAPCASATTRPPWERAQLVAETCSCGRAVPDGPSSAHARSAPCLTPTWPTSISSDTAHADMRLRTPPSPTTERSLWASSALGWQRAARADHATPRLGSGRPYPPHGEGAEDVSRNACAEGPRRAARADHQRPGQGRPPHAARGGGGRARGQAWVGSSEGAR
jgi:hypothetical protein